MTTDCLDCRPWLYLAKPERVIAIIKEELDAVKRNLRMIAELADGGEVLSLEDEDLIEEADVLITLSNKAISNV